MMLSNGAARSTATMSVGGGYCSWWQMQGGTFAEGSKEIVNGLILCVEGVEESRKFDW
jgi:hypothetical protein